MSRLPEEVNPRKRVDYTISDDWTGARGSVKKQRLCALETKMSGSKESRLRIFLQETDAMHSKGPSPLHGGSSSDWERYVPRSPSTSETLLYRNPTPLSDFSGRHKRLSAATPVANLKPKLSSLPKQSNMDSSRAQAAEEVLERVLQAEQQTYEQQVTQQHTEDSKTEQVSAFAQMQQYPERVMNNSGRPPSQRQMSEQITNIARDMMTSAPEDQSGFRRQRLIHTLSSQQIKHYHRRGIDPLADYSTSLL